MGTPATDGPRSRNGTARFGVFEFDLGALKLYRNGYDAGLQQQPALLLAELVAHAGRVVTRDQLRDRIWPSGTYVEFDYGLNTTVNRLRRVLRDSASQPQYIETVPKQGYRFIAAVEMTSPAVDAAQAADDPLGTAVDGRAARAASSRRRAVRWIAAAAVATVALATAVVYERARVGGAAAQGGAVVRSYVSLPAGHVPEGVVISPAGDQIVYEAASGAVRQLYRRYLHEEESRPIPDSAGARQPFFSPDGSELGFYTRASIRVIGPNGARDIVAVAPEFTQRKAIWGEDGCIYFTTPEQGIWRAPARGGPAEPVVKPPQSVGGPFYFPQQVLGAGAPRLLYSTNNGPRRRWIGEAAVGAPETNHVVVERAMGGQVLPGGELVYYWQGSLMAAPYDGRTGRLLGSPVEAVPNVASGGWQGGVASVSKNGTLVYVERRLPQRRLLWVDGRGRETALPVPQATYEQAEVSPDGAYISIARQDRPGSWSLWLYATRSGGWTRLLDQDLPVLRSVWSPDSKSVVVSAAMGDADFVNLYRIPVAEPHTPQRLTEQPYFGHFPGSWSAGANALLFTEGVHDRTQSDILALPLGTSQSPRPMVVGPGVDRAPAFSPDGNWFAYTSATPKGASVFVQRFDQTSPALEVSRDGGSDPAWSPDGRHLYFLSREHALMKVAWDGHGVQGEPQVLFPPRFAEIQDWWTRAYSVAPDGRFLVARNVPDDAAAGRIRVVVNWTSELRRLLPGR